MLHGGSRRPIDLIGGTAGLWGASLDRLRSRRSRGLMALIVGLAVGLRFQRGITKPLRGFSPRHAKVREQPPLRIRLTLWRARFGQ